MILPKEVLKQVLKRMEVLSRANEDLDNGLEEKKAGHKVRRLAREKKRPPKWVSPDELMEQLGAEAEKEEKEEKKEKEEKEEKKKMGGKEGKEKKEKKEKKTDEEKEKKKEKKREKARAADFEADVKEAMTRVLGRAYSREEMDSMGPMDRRKYGEKKGALEEALGGLRAKREEEDAGLKEWKGGEGRLDLKEEGGRNKRGKTRHYSSIQSSLISTCSRTPSCRLRIQSCRAAPSSCPAREHLRPPM